MAHNPILKHSKLGTAPPEIGRAQLGVLRRQGVFQVLEPGSALSWAERWSLRNSDFYLVDCREHDWKWSLRLESADEQCPFWYTIRLTYSVKQPDRVVAQNVGDLERHLARKLTPALQSIAGARRLNEYTAVSSALRRAIQDHDAFEEAGVELLEAVQIDPTLTVEDRAFIAELDALQEAQTKPQRATRSGKLPTNSIYKFDATVTLQYRITDLGRLRRLADVEQAVTWLWEGEIQKVLRPISRQFTIEEEGKAESALNAELERQSFAAYGLLVLSASIDIAPEEKAFDVLSEDTQLERKFQLERRKGAHESASMRNRFDMLTQMIVRGELTYRDALNYLDGKELEATNLPLETMKTLIGLDVLDADTGADASKAILINSLMAAVAKQNPAEAQTLQETILRRLNGGSAGPALPPQDQAVPHNDHSEKT